MIKEIERLNREIDRIMTEKTKADAQKEVWESRLVESIKGYSKDYGVDLSGKDLVEIKKKLVAETNMIEAKTKEEFERASKIVKLINEGDINGAWKVLGVDIENKESEEVVQEKANVEVQSAVEAIEEMGDDDFYGESFEEEEEEDYIESNDPVDFDTSVKNTAASKFNSFFMEDDEDDEEEDNFVIPNTKVVSPVENKHSNSKPSKSSTSSSFVMEDDEEDEFGGFGSILSGSKFKV